jgi:hypothetical protein
VQFRDAQCARAQRAPPHHLETNTQQGGDLT